MGRRAGYGRCTLRARRRASSQQGKPHGDGMHGSHQRTSHVLIELSSLRGRVTQCPRRAIVVLIALGQLLSSCLIERSLTSSQAQSCQLSPTTIIRLRGLSLAWRAHCGLQVRTLKRRARAARYGHLASASPSIGINVVACARTHHYPLERQSAASTARIMRHPLRGMAYEFHPDEGRKACDRSD